MAKTQIAFYGSTPNYAFQFDDLGFEGTTARLGERLRAGDIPGMAALITDEMLEHFAVVAPWDEIADRLVERYAGVATRIVSYLAAESIRRDPPSSTGGVRLHGPCVGHLTTPAVAGSTNWYPVIGHAGVTRRRHDERKR